MPSRTNNYNSSQKLILRSLARNRRKHRPALKKVKASSESKGEMIAIESGRSEVAGCRGGGESPGQGAGGLQRSQEEPGKGMGCGETIPGAHCSSQNEAARNSTLPGE